MSFRCGYRGTEMRSCREVGRGGTGMGRRSFYSAVLLSVLFCFFVSFGSSSADIVTPPGGGAGSYSTSVPGQGTKPDGVTVVKAVPPAVGPNVLPGETRKVPTSDWWTPLAWVDPADLPDPSTKPAMNALSWQVFSEPFVFQPQKGGLAAALNMPDSRRAAMKDGTITAGEGFMLEVVGDDTHGLKGISPYFNAFFDQDLYLGSTAAGWNEAAYTGVKVTGWSDWFVNFSMSSPGEVLDITAGAGSPFLLIKTKSGRPQATVRTWNIGKVIPLEGAGFSLNAGMAKDQDIPSSAFAVINHVPFGPAAGGSEYSAYTVYAFFGPSGSTWKLTDVQKDEGRVLNTAVCSTGNYFAVALLPYAWGKSIYDEPDEAKVKDLLAFFSRYAFAEVTDTRVTPGYAPQADGHDISVTYACTTVPVGTETPAAGAPLRAMYPHQYLGQPQVYIIDQLLKQVSSDSREQGWYWPSLKGPLLLASGNSFVNVLEVPPCLPAPVDAPEKAKADRMAGYIRQAYESRNPHFLNQGSYFGAQEMHRLAMLLPVADMIKSTASDPAAVEKAAEDIYTYLAGQMGIWLRASRDGGTTPKNAAERLFYYDSRWGSLIPTPEDGFAADSLLNDHHFHYGYFLKIATELARWEKTHPGHPANKKWAEAYAPMIRLLIKDIANIERTGAGTDPDFPFLRHFSPYAGHSWASGSSRGNQGGQQESTPEAIQAWAAILLWSQLNFPEYGENADLERWAAYMFASEARAAELYWFGLTDVKEFKPHLSFRQYSLKSDAVPKPYVPSMVSQVNQNEMTYQTDFGNPPALKLGIQVLPFTGSSFYLGSVKGNADAIVSGFLDNDLPKLADGGTSPSNKDKILMLQALTENHTADPRALITPAGGTSPLDSWRMQWEIPTPTYDNLILQDTSRGAMYWWIDTLLVHGVPHHGENDANSTSAASFRNDRGDTVYTAYNPGTSPLLVTFADGNTLEVPSLEYAHEKTDASSGSGGGCSSGPITQWMPLLLLPVLFLLRR